MIFFSLRFIVSLIPMGINLMSQQNKNTTQITRKLFEAKKKKRKEKKPLFNSVPKAVKKKLQETHTFFKRQHSFIRRKKTEEYLKYCFESQENELQYIVDLVYCIVIPYSTQSTAISYHTLHYSLPEGQTSEIEQYPHNHGYSIH